MLPLASLSDMLNGSEDRVETPMSLTTMKEDAERVYRDWDDALGRKDVEAAIALYAPDCVLESPLVSHLLNAERGVVEGREKLFARAPPARKRHREGFFTDGRRLIWEYPRATPIGDQMDFVESMELNDEGLISSHRVYWGWFGVAVLQRDEYRR
jgi:SnoaL-like domain